VPGVPGVPEVLGVPDGSGAGCEATGGEAHRSLGGLVRRGVAWTSLDVAVNRTGGFLMGLIVARVLAPRDFGIYAVALVVHTILINISDLGLGTALIIGDEDELAANAPTVTTIAMISGVVLGLLMALPAGEFARLLGAPRAADTIRVMALTLPLAGLVAVPSALLRRAFRMDRMFVADTANTVVGGVVAIGLALAGLGPVALALSFVAGQLVTTVLVFVYSPARYGPGWNRRRARKLLRFGMPLVGANIVGLSIQNVDYIIVGRLLGAVPLGLYMLAFNMSGWPQNVFSAVIRSVSFPAFARMREDSRDMPREFINALRMVSRLTLPVCLFLGALSHPLIVFVYGPKWAAASHALVGLSILAAGRTIMELFSDFLVSLERTRTLFVIQIVWFVPLTAALLVLVPRLGITGAGIAHATVADLIVVPTFVYCVYLVGVRPAMVARTLLPAIAWTTLTAAIAWLIASRVHVPAIAVAAGGSVGLGIYLIPYVGELRRALAGRDLRIRRRRQHAPAVEPA